MAPSVSEGPRVSYDGCHVRNNEAWPTDWTRCCVGRRLADMIGTTIETTIRIMSRWGKDGLVRTEKDGFLVQDRAVPDPIVRSNHE